MSKLIFTHSVMNSGKSTTLLQRNHNMIQQGRKTFLISPSHDRRYGEGKITSKIGDGVSAASHSIKPLDSLYDAVCHANATEGPLSAVFVDEAQFFTEEQVWDMTRVADELEIAVYAFGLRVDAFGKLFPGSKALIEMADTIKTPDTDQECFCGRPATMNMRFDEDGHTVRAGEVIQTGGDERYRSVCRLHWREVQHISECFAEDYID